MKRMLIVLLFTAMSLMALLFGVSCSNQSNPAFVGPVQAVATNNPAWTPTWTFTFTPIVNTPTPNPYPVSNFNGPYALAVDSKNNIYVGDTGNNLVKQFVNGVLTSWPVGKVKSNGLTYISPQAIAVDSSDNLYLVGNGNAVSKYDTYGNYITQYTASMSGPLGVAISGNPATILYVSDSGNKQIISIALPGGTASIFQLSLAFVPYGLAVDSMGNVYVAGSDNDVHMYSSTGVAGSPIVGFNAPYAVAFDANNDLFVSDTKNAQIEEFAAGNYAASPVNVIGLGTLASPEGIALDSFANVYAVDSSNNELFQFP